MKQTQKGKHAKLKPAPKPVSIGAVIRPVLQLAILLFFTWIALQDPSSADDLATGPLPFFGWLIMCGILIFHFPVWARWVLGIGAFCVVFVGLQLNTYYLLKYSAYGAAADYQIFMFLGYGLLLVGIRLIVVVIQFFQTRICRHR